MSIAQGRIFGLNSFQKVQRNMCPKVKQYEDVGILTVKVSDGITARVTYKE
jgi:hypothetical protein